MLNHKEWSSQASKLRGARTFWFLFTIVATRAAKTSILRYDGGCRVEWYNYRSNWSYGTFFCNPKRWLDNSLAMKNCFKNIECTLCLHVRWVFSNCSLSDLSVISVHTLSVLWVISKLSLSVLWVCSGCSLSVLAQSMIWVYSKLHW